MLKMALNCSHAAISEFGPEGEKKITHFHNFSLDNCDKIGGIISQRTAVLFIRFSKF